MHEGAAANGFDTTRVLAVLARRRRLGKVIGGVCAVALLAFLGFVGARVHALSQEFPQQEHVTYQMGEDIPCPGSDGVTFRVDKAAWLSDTEAKELCPRTYESETDSGGAVRLLRIDILIQNEGKEAFGLSELNMSALTLGKAWGSANDLMAMGEAFPEQDYTDVAAGQSRRMSILYSCAAGALTSEQWDHIEELPAGYQFSVWPKVMTVELS